MANPNTNKVLAISRKIHNHRLHTIISVFEGEKVVHADTCSQQRYVEGVFLHEGFRWAKPLSNLVGPDLRRTDLERIDDWYYFHLRKFDRPQNGTISRVNPNHEMVVSGNAVSYADFCDSYRAFVAHTRGRGWGWFCNHRSSKGKLKVVEYIDIII